LVLFEKIIDSGSSGGDRMMQSSRMMLNPVIS
jgi:hypothetical protein